MIKLPLKRKRGRVYLNPKMAKTICPQEVQPGVTVSTVTGVLQVKDNIHDLLPLEPTKEELADEHKSKPAGPPQPYSQLRTVRYEWGTLDINLLLKKLAQDGFTDLKVEQGSADEVTLLLPSEDTVIKVSEKSTDIVCGGKQSLRLKLRDLLLQCVQSF